MPDHLRRLLNSHEFLQNAIRDHSATMLAEHLDALLIERNRVFDELVNYASDHPQVTLAQLRFLLTALEDLAGDKFQAERLRRTCLTAVERLIRSRGRAAAAADPTAERSADPEGAQRALANSLADLVSPQATWLLDSLSDRATICSRDYTYVFVNKASAAFHRRSVSDFLGKDARAVVGEESFFEISKPMMDKCFSGQTVSYQVCYKDGRRSTAFSARFEPLRNASGDVIATLYTARQVPLPGAKCDFVVPVSK